MIQCKRFTESFSAFASMHSTYYRQLVKANDYRSARVVQWWESNVIERDKCWRSSLVSKLNMDLNMSWLVEALDHGRIELCCSKLLWESQSLSITFTPRIKWQSNGKSATIQQLSSRYPVVVQQLEQSRVFPLINPFKLIETMPCESIGI